MNDDASTTPFAPEPSATSWTAGGLVASRYMVEERVGKGGMGAVYRAVDLATGAPLALKRLGRGTTAALVRFKREFHAARRLSHPNCVRVYELGQHENSWFFSMEYVEGGHLEPATCPTPFDVARVACQVLGALDHIHARHIVHRDVKPQNIVVDNATREAKISDLGIALVDDAEAAFTVGQRMGSARYLSPEQARGEAADARTDLYSFGVVIYELLTGAMPFIPAVRSFEGWLDAHASTPAKWPSDPKLPRELVEIAMRMIEKDPRDRFPTAAAAFDAFAAWLSRTPEGAAVLARIPPLERKGYVAAPDFVGRQKDLRVIDEFVRAVIAGDHNAPLFLRVSGDGGIGKSRLVSRVLPMLDRKGASVLFGACPPQGSSPYEPLGSLFALRRASGVREVPESEAPTRPNTAESPRDSQPDLIARADGFEKRDAQLWRLYRGLVDALIEHTSDRPGIILIEDLQWADAASIDLLGFVIRALAQARAQGVTCRVGIIVTNRREVSPEVHKLVDLASELGVARAIELRPFGADEASELVSAMLSVPRDAQIDRLTERLLAHSEGTPLFISQALHLLVGSGQLVRGATGWNLDDVQTQSIKFPTSVREAIGDRASRLKVGTQSALGIASVKGPRFTLADILPLVEIAEPELIDDMDEAVREGFINEEAEEGHYAFAHDRIRESIYDRLPVEAKRPIHRAIAEQMYARHGRTKERAAEIAHHAWEGGDARAAYTQWWLAGDLAMQHYAFARAAEMYTRALEASNALGRPPRSALLERRGDACLQAGLYQAARESYARRLDSAASDLERAELLRRQAEVERRAGNTALAGDRFEHVLRALRFRVPRSRPGFVLGVIYNVLCSIAMLVLPFLRRKKSRQDRKTQIIARTCGALAERYYWSDFLRAAFYQFAGLRIAERLGPSPELTVALAQQGFGVSVYGFYRIGLRYLDRARACGEQVATPVEQGWQELMRGMSHACAGRVDDHIAAERAAERLLASCPETLRLRQVWTIAGEAYLEAGRLADAERVSTQLLQMSLDVSDGRGEGWARYLQGHLLLWRGEIDAARSELEEAVALSTRSDDLTYRLAATGRLISARIQGGDTANALALGIESARTLAKARLRNPTIVIDGVTLAAAALARTAGSLDDVTRTTVRHILRWRSSPARDMRYTTPWYLVGKGAWRRASGRVSSGDRLISRGLRLAEDRQLLGEQYELHQYLSRFFASDPPRAMVHERAGEQLRAAVSR